jgi:fatty-acyl-CoA synthase
LLVWALSARIDHPQGSFTVPSIFEQDLPKTAANFVPLSPLSFIERTQAVYPTRTAIIYGERRITWAETYTRCRRLASALAQLGVCKGDTVAVMLPNIPAMVELHFGVPMLGAVLNTLNTRLDAATLAFMLDHGEAKVLLVDPEFRAVIQSALALRTRSTPITLIDVADATYSTDHPAISNLEYEDLLAQGDPDYAWSLPSDEWDAISLNYTSGTTGNPKGVVFHHRGAALSALSSILEWDLAIHPVWLWVVPMFHCNGWCFPWVMAARAGVNVCLRKLDPQAMFDAIRTHRVSHYAAAPIVHNTLMNAPAAMKAGIDHPVKAFIGGNAPSAALLEGMEQMGFSLTHIYGLTEVYGPATICVAHDDWPTLDIGSRAKLQARQGVAYHLQQGATVLDPTTMQRVPADGETIGEVMFRGNLTMKGYLKNPAATEEAFAGGWFHTGDLGVLEPDGYIKIKDRSKDIIISGGENISSIEVEDALYRHPAVMVAAVVAMPDAKWGETPCAFIELKAGYTPTPAEIIAHCKGLLASYKVPRAVVFGELPKTSTGKIQKFELRQRVGSVTAINH